ncbi:MAG TPA: hypothetical protein VGH38_09640, partial [Bryobacteraceae bacterium]
AVTHLDGTLVTPTHSAQIGETLSLYLTGLGTVNPLVPDGSAGPVSPLSNVTNTIGVDVQGIAATVGYAGLAPQLAGLYQINFTVPTGVKTGDNFIDISGPDSYNAQALISVGAGPSLNSSEVAALRHRLRTTPAGLLTPSVKLPAEPLLNRR